MNEETVYDVVGDNAVLLLYVKLNDIEQYRDEVVYPDVTSVYSSLINGQFYQKKCSSSDSI